MALIKRIADTAASLEGLSLLVSLIVGVGVLAFITGAWVLQLYRTENYVLAGLLAVAAAVTGLASVARVPLALIISLGAAIVAGVAYATGTLPLLLP